MGPKWAKMDRSMSPWMAGLRLATWIVDIFYWFGSAVWFYCLALLIFCGGSALCGALSCSPRP